jgi:hypothetical protein
MGMIAQFFADFTSWAVTKGKRTMMNDAELQQKYEESQSEAAFTGLPGLHVNRVCSTDSLAKQRARDRSVY